MYAAAFPSLAKRPPQVIYPAINIEAYQNSIALKGKSKAKTDDGIELVDA